MTLPKDVFSLFGTCFGILSDPIISPVSYTHLDVYKRQVLWLMLKQ